PPAWGGCVSRGPTLASQGEVVFGVGAGGASQGGGALGVFCVVVGEDPRDVGIGAMRVGSGSSAAMFPETEPFPCRRRRSISWSSGGVSSSQRGRVTPAAGGGAGAGRSRSVPAGAGRFRTPGSNGAGRSTPEGMTTKV